MAKTYVVTGEYGKHEERIEEILYAGDSLERATSVEMAHYDSLSMEVWVDGICIKSLLKEAGERKFRVHFDKITQLQDSVDKKREELETEEKLLESLKSLD